MVPLNGFRILEIAEIRQDIPRQMDRQHPICAPVAAS